MSKKLDEIIKAWGPVSNISLEMAINAYEAMKEAQGEILAIRLENKELRDVIDDLTLFQHRNHELHMPTNTPPHGPHTVSGKRPEDLKYPDGTPCVLPNYRCATIHQGSLITETRGRKIIDESRPSFTITPETAPVGSFVTYRANPDMVVRDTILEWSPGGRWFLFNRADMDWQQASKINVIRIEKPEVIPPKPDGPPVVHFRDYEDPGKPE